MTDDDIFQSRQGKGGIPVYRYYMGIAIMSLFFGLFGMILSENAAAFSTIMVGFAGAFMAIAFITSGPESRW